MIINSNIPALNTHRQMGINQNAMQNSMEKLSSGLRINKAGDDAAGLAISEKMRAQIKGLDQASRNAQDGISLIQTAEGALDETHSILQRMRELSVQSSNDTNVSVDREELQKEVDQLSQELNRISDNTEFNTQNLLDGDFSGKFHIGANTGQDIDLAIGDMSAEALNVKGVETAGTGSVDTNISLSSANGEKVTVETAAASTSDISETTATFDKDTNTITVTYAEDSSGGNGITGTLQNAADAINGLGVGVTASVADTNKGDAGTGGGSIELDAAIFSETKGIDISNQESASTAIETINKAIETVSAERSMLGATQNRLEHTISNLDNSSENLSAAESRIRDVDMAKEMMEMTRANILSQASQSMLAQANSMPQSVLQLLG